MFGFCRKESSGVANCFCMASDALTLARGKGSTISKPAGFTGRSVCLATSSTSPTTRAVALPSAGGVGVGWFIGGWLLMVMVAGFGMAVSFRNARRGRASRK